MILGECAIPKPPERDEEAADPMTRYDIYNHYWALRKHRLELIAEAKKAKEWLDKLDKGHPIIVYILNYRDVESSKKGVIGVIIVPFMLCQCLRNESYCLPLTTKKEGGIIPIVFVTEESALAKELKKEGRRLGDCLTGIKGGPSFTEIIQIVRPKE